MERKHRRRRRWKRRLIVAAIALVVITSGVVLGIVYYPKLNQQRLLRTGHEAVKSKSYQAAAISFRRVLQINDRNIEATRGMAELAETVGAGEALYWRRRMVELEPANEANHVALVERAIQSRNVPAMRDAVAKLLQMAPGKAKSQFLAGRVSLATNEISKAREYFSEAVRLEPGDVDYQYELAEARLLSNDRSESEQARKEIEAALQDPERFSRASRTLIADAIRRNDFGRAITLSNALQKSPSASFQDRLAHLAVLKKANSPAYPVFLEDLQESAADKPENVTALISWLCENGAAMVAIEWSKRLSPETISTYPIPVALASAYAAIGDWQGLKPMVEVTAEPPVAEGEPVSAPAEKTANDWKEYEFLRKALHAWTLRRTGSVNESKVEWNDAVSLAGRNPQALLVLVKAADNWGWSNEAMDVLWLIAEQPTLAQVALAELNNRYFKANNTRGLLRVTTRQVQLDPQDLPTKNNLASFLLLSGDPKQGLQVAEELYKAKPEDPAYTSTYAFALYMHGRTDEAVQLMKGLGEDRLKEPAYAAYLGVMLSDTPQREEARKWLELGRSAPLLPEERKLLEDASAKLAGSR